MNSNWFKILLKAMKVRCGKNLQLAGVPLIFNKRGAVLKIGDNCTIKSSFLSNLVGLYSRTIIVTRAPGAEIVIGNNVGISGATVYARKKISIGDNTCIGGNCIILKGTVLGDGCVVGAGAVVAGKFGAGCVIAENPATMIRKLSKYW